MDDIFLPEEEEVEESMKDLGFETHGIDLLKQKHPSGLDASDYVRVSFGRFVALIGTQTFNEVVTRNKDEEIILTSNLLTDLAASRRLMPSPRGSLMVFGAVLCGILLGYILF